MCKGRDRFESEEITAEVCIIGGGMAGVAAALSSARHGASTVLLHERPVLGGNSSSECRVHIGGADRANSIPHMRETGILEELRQENLYINPHREHSLWDYVLYDKSRQEKNLQMILNCSCTDAETDGNLITSITGWQQTTQKWITVRAKIFIDCSGDSILAPLTGAAFRRGREARSEFGESIAPEEADDLTMGMTCYFMSRERDTPQPYEPPSWANTYKSCDDLPSDERCNRPESAFLGHWWIELGGEDDAIADTEKLRDRLLAITLGVWDHYKNHCPNRVFYRRHSLEWLQFLPGKRESRRYEGDHILTQLDVEAGGQFEDTIAYGGWPMDDHHPAGFGAVKLHQPATQFHHAPSPFGIPYRSLYSRNIDNLMFAGRNISATHAAMSSTRVMATVTVMGQAAGTAAALAIEKSTSPRGVGQNHIGELQQLLMADDCYLPGIKQELDGLCLGASLRVSQGDGEALRDGHLRQIGDNPHAWTARPGDQATYKFESPADISEVTITVDTAMDCLTTLTYHREALLQPAEVTPRNLLLEGLKEGEWIPLWETVNNYQRHLRIPVRQRVEGLRLTPRETWGPCDGSRIYGFTFR